MYFNTESSWVQRNGAFLNNPFHTTSLATFPTAVIQNSKYNYVHFASVFLVLYLELLNWQKGFGKNCPKITMMASRVIYGTISTRPSSLPLVWGSCRQIPRAKHNPRTLDCQCNSTGCLRLFSTTKSFKKTFLRKPRRLQYENVFSQIHPLKPVSRDLIWKNSINRKGS